MLLSAGEIAEMRATQAEAWPEVCTILRSTQTANAIGERVVSWSTVATGVSCRLAPSEGQSRQTPMAQQQTVIVTWWLTVATTVDLRSGDRVMVDGVVYEVVNAFDYGAWETALRCELREVERG